MIFFNLDNQHILTPFPTLIYNKNRLNFIGFREYALDRLLILTNNNYPLTNITNKLNQFVNINTEFGNKHEFVQEFIKAVLIVESFSYI